MGAFEANPFEGQPRWWQGTEDRQTPMQLHRNWPAIERTPCIVLGEGAERDVALTLLYLYLEAGRTVRVIVA